MKTKKLLSLFAAVLFTANLMAFDHGSMKGTAVPLYPIRDGAAPGTAIAGTTFDYKIVTIGTKTWAWTKLNGKTIAGNTWSSQLRFWTPVKVEKNLLGRIAGTQETYGTATGAPSAVITFLQEDNNVFFETADINYNSTSKNSADGNDTEKPVLADPVKGAQTATSVQLTLSATDNSNDFFYYITDATNNLVEVLFTNSTTLTLNQGVNYSLSIYAVDFSGNTSDAKVVNVTGQTFECNNLLSAKTLSIGQVQFLPNWVASTNYTSTIQNKDISISLTDATYADWQAQFPIMVETPVVLTPGAMYSLVLDVALTKNTTVYVKFYDTDDNQFMDIPRQTLNAGNNALSRFNITCPAGLAKVSKILFDFGGNPANAGIEITNLSLCGNETGTGLNDNKIIDKISISQLKNEISISSENVINSVSLYSATGQFIPVTFQNNLINTSKLTKGIYMLNVSDISGHSNTFKVMVK